jgi:ElaB/YqjD/DUF883 family membrane-anchored ribosome-binding protein
MSESSVDRLVDDLRRVMHDVDALIGATANAASDTISTARARAEQTLLRARDHLKTVEGTVGEQAEEVVEEADRYVHKNPWAAVGIAAAAGLVIGILVGRR